MLSVVEAYRLLGIDGDADENTVKKACRRSLRKAHPDMGGSTEQFLLVKEAIKLVEEYKPQPVFRFGANVFDIVIK